LTEFGYAGKILKIDLSDGKVSQVPTAEYADRFLGGHGIAAKLYWDMVPPRAKAFDPENCLIYASGPVAGFSRFAGSRWKICGKSVLGDRESFNYSNLGEKWGTFLKFAGYDALAVQGKADKPVSIFINNGTVAIKDAIYLRGKLTFDVVDTLKEEYGKDASILTIGPAGEKLLTYATVFADEGASGSGGLGAVMGSKNLKAIIVASGNNRPQAAHPERLQKIADEIREMRPPGGLPSLWKVPGLTQEHTCYGCGMGCGRHAYSLNGGRRYKSLCESSIFYSWAVEKYTGKADGAQLLATRLCDGYGIDTSVMHGMIEWIDACQEAGLITEEQTGLPVKKVGSAEFIEKLTGIIARQEGFGEILARGTMAAAKEIGTEAEKRVHRYISTRGSETKDYDPRVLITTSLIYATEPRRAIQQLHSVCSPLMAWLGTGEGQPGESFTIENFRNVAEKFWGSAISADFSTLEGKPLAAKTVQDRAFAKESLVLCDPTWPMMIVKGGVGDATLESRIYSAITGRETDEQELNKAGERIFNLQRAILLRQGWRGRQDDRLLDYYHTEPLEKGELFWNADGLVPGKDGEIISKIGTVVVRDDFEKLKDEYYGLRGWDVASGLPTAAKLEELELPGIVQDLRQRDLVK
jgi:aldehyde:ferredoxin oxidoreductase